MKFQRFFFAFLFFVGVTTRLHADDLAPNLQSALSEMNAIESQIEQLLQEQAGRKQEIDTLSRDVRIAGEFLNSGSRTRDEAKKTLDHLQVEVSRDLNAMEQAELSGRRQLEQARESLQISTPLLLYASQTRASDDPAALTLALVHMRERQQAQFAVEQLLRIEELRASRISDRERISGLAQRHAAFAGMKVEDLRKRHRELSNQLERLAAATNNGQTSFVQLSERRKSLNGLIARLSAGGSAEAEHKSVAATATSREVASAVSPVPRVINPELPASVTPPKGGLPEVQNEEEQTQLALGTREGDGAATVKLEIRPGATPEEANRRWRAGASKVHAITAGRVMFSGPFAGYGHLLVLDHGNGWVSVYGNMTDCTLREGQALTAGQLVGEYHPEAAKKPEPLWIEVRQNTRPVPIESLPGADQGWESRVFDQAAL